MDEPSKLEQRLVERAGRGFDSREGRELFRQSADRLANMRRSLESLIDDDCQCDQCNEYRGLLKVLTEDKPDA